MIKKAINTLKAVAVGNNHQDIIVVIEGTKNSNKLIKLLDLTFDNKCPWEVIHYSSYQVKPKGRGRRKLVNTFGKYLKDNPKKFIILERINDKEFVKGQKDIRPLKYLEIDEVI